MREQVKHSVVDTVRSDFDCEKLHLEQNLLLQTFFEMLVNENSFSDYEVNDIGRFLSATAKLAGESASFWLCKSNHKNVLCVAS